MCWCRRQLPPACRARRRPPTPSAARASSLGLCLADYPAVPPGRTLRARRCLSRKPHAGDTVSTDRRSWGLAARAARPGAGRPASRAACRAEGAAGRSRPAPASPGFGIPSLPSTPSAAVALPLGRLIPTHSAAGRHRKGSLRRALRPFGARLRLRSACGLVRAPAMPSRSRTHASRRLHKAAIFHHSKEVA